MECSKCKDQADYTDQMVLDNLIRGLADEEIKRKVLATNETDYTLAKVLRFVEAEESGKFSLSDSKMFDTVAGMSGFKRQQGEVAKQNEVIPPKVCHTQGLLELLNHAHVERVWGDLSSLQCNM